MPTIHIVEPTLKTEIGHCFSFIQSVCHAGPDAQWMVWANRSATVSFALPNVQMQRYFHRRLRRPQCLLLYRKLLRTGDKLFVSTASTIDLLLVHWAAQGQLPAGRVYLYVHWLHLSDRKVRWLNTIAKLQPDLMVFGPVPSVVEVLAQAGFRQARLVPYPAAVAAVAETSSGSCGDPAVLYAGAARQDKGIGHVVDLAEHMQRVGSTVPVRLQSAPNHHGEYDALTAADMQRLAGIRYPYLGKRRSNQL